MTGTATFNLIDEPWIPMLGFDGREREVSLRDAILSAHEHRDIAGELPTTRFALLRIILSVVYRVLDREIDGDPTEAWGELWRQDRLPTEGFERYFDEWRPRFDLLDSLQPFMQTPDLRTAKDEWKSIALIVADTEPDGALFTMRSELDSLSLPEAARWLVHAHAYDYSGIKSGAVGDDRVKGGKGYPMGVGWAGWLGGTVLGGKNMRETILLNLILGRTESDPRDTPIWERPVLSATERGPEEIGTIGPVSLMSWPQRRIRLRTEGDRVTAVLVSNGDPLDYTVRNNDELMTGWRFSEPQSAKAKALRYMPRKLEPGQALWRGLSTLIPTAESARPSSAAAKKWNIGASAAPAQTLTWLGRLVDDGEIEGDAIVEVSVVSIEYGTQNASFADVISDRLSFAAAIADLGAGAGLLDLAQTASRRAKDSVDALQRLARDLERAAGGDGEGAEKRAGDDAYAALDRRFREWLLEVKPDCDSAALLAKWTEFVRSTVRSRAEALAVAAPPSAWIGRPSSLGGQILSVATAMKWFENALFRTLGVPAATERTEQQNERGDGGIAGTEAAE